MQADMDKVFSSLLLAFTLVFPFAAEGQVPWENLPVADSLFTAKNYPQALEFYKPVLAFYEDRKALLNGARCAAQAGETKLALKYAGRAVALGRNSSWLLKNDKEFEPLRKESRFMDLIKKTEEQEARSAAMKNDAILAELDSLSANDKKYRKQKGMEAEQARLDSLNGIRLKRLLDQHGWLGSNLLGGRNYCWVVLQRQPLDFQKKYIGLMKKAVKKGEEERSFLAFLEDQMLLEQGKKQKYGTQVDREKKVAYPLQNPEKVDIFRAKAGLGPYKEFLKIWKIE